MDEESTHNFALFFAFACAVTVSLKSVIDFASL